MYLKQQNNNKVKVIIKSHLTNCFSYWWISVYDVRHLTELSMSSDFIINKRERRSKDFMVKTVKLSLLSTKNRIVPCKDIYTTWTFPHLSWYNCKPQWILLGFLAWETKTMCIRVKQNNHMVYFTKKIIERSVSMEKENKSNQPPSCLLVRKRLSAT